MLSDLVPHEYYSFNSIENSGGFTVPLFTLTGVKYKKKVFRQTKVSSDDAANHSQPSRETAYVLNATV